LDWYTQHLSPVRKRLATWLRRVIKQQLLRRSEPYQALRQRDEKLIQRFFRQTKRPAAFGE
jgi:hypothetical protein